MDVLREFTAQQVQIARQSNPLTGLPGNREIDAQLGQLMLRQRPFIACHLDLDHFKEFNDAYGYSRGDQVLLHVAQAIKSNVMTRVDFVGHLGGDDFVFFLKSPDACLRLTTLVSELSASLLNFHSSEHRAAGGYDSHNQEGQAFRCGLLSVSIGAMEAHGARGASVEAVADELRRTKALAKAIHGNSCLLSSGTRVIDLLQQSRLPELPATETVVLQMRA